MVRTVQDDIRFIADRFPGKLFLKKYDLLDIDQLPVLIKSTVAEHGPIGGFVHCAGFDKMAPLYMNKVSDIETLWRLHALVPMVIIAAISKRKNYAEETSIVLISSQAAHEGAKGHTAYAAAKGAIEGFLAPAAAELMEKGIRINEVCLRIIRKRNRTDNNVSLGKRLFQFFIRVSFCHNIIDFCMIIHGNDFGAKGSH